MPTSKRRSGTRILLRMLCMIALCICARPVLGQASGTIVGTVTDASGAVIPQAQVTATNVGTKAALRAQTDSNGQFTISFVPVGTYQLQAVQKGFAQFLQNNIVVHEFVTVPINVQLSIETEVTQVVVKNAPPLMQSESTNLVQVVDQQHVQDLPLNGRDISQLLTLSSGVTNQNTTGGPEGSILEIATLGTATNAGNYTMPVSVNGSRGNGSNFYLDNAPNNDIYTNIAAPFPDPDAVEEVTMQTGNFDAQYGRSLGGVLSAVTRSGTDRYHGLAFEYLRNSDFDARNYFTGLDTLRRNQFGGTFGGPLDLGRLYQSKGHTFFFFSYQGTRQSTATSGALELAPSQAMKNGDFSAWLNPNGVGAIHDPNNPGTYFQGNKIPSGDLNPVAQRILQKLPTSTASNYQVRIATPVSHVNDDQYLINVDHTINSTNRLSLRYFQLNYNQPWAVIPNNLYYIANGQTGQSYNAVANWTWTANAHLVNQFTLAMFMETPKASPPAVFADDTYQGFGANINTFPGSPQMGLTVTSWNPINIPTAYYVPRETYTLDDTVSWLHGRHNVRFGGEIQKFRLDFSAPAQTGGSMTFGGQELSDPGKSNAGNSFSEFELGVGTTFLQQSDEEFRVLNNFPSLFVQDDYRMTPRLTINAGLRWEPVFGYRERNNKEATFIPGQQSSRFPNAPLGLIYAGDPQVGSTVVRPDYENFGPRIGYAFQALKMTVVRSAYGIFFDHNPAIVDNRAAQGQPFLKQAVITGPFSLTSPYGSAAPMIPNAITPTSGATFTPYGTWALQSPNQRSGYVQEWNLIVEQQLRSDLLIRVGYVGSKGSRLLDSIEQNAAVYIPGICGASACSTVANENARRPYQPIGPLELGLSAAFSTYNSLQVTVQKQMSHGFSALANYTWSKSIDDNSYSSIEGNSAGPAPNDLKLNRAVSDFNVPNQFVLSGMLKHPAFTNANAFVRTAFGGWQSNLIFSAVSGTPFSVTSGVDNALTGVGGQWADYAGGGYYLPGGRSKAQKINQWFNTSAFKVNRIGTVGTPLRNRLVGPDYTDMDYSLFKSFLIGERLKLELRGEFFNVLNHTNLGASASGVTSPIFGQITTAKDPRIGQVAARISF